MNELIFFAVIVLFSILESVARKRKAAAEGEEGEVRDAEYSPSEIDPPPVGREGGRRRRSVEEEEEGAFPTTWETERAPRIPESMPEFDQSEGSAGMIPAEIWAEIEGLARGRADRSPTPIDRPTRASREGPVELPAPPRPEVTVPTTTREEHFVHRSHAGYGTDPSARAPADVSRVADEPRSESGKRLQRVLRGQRGREALRDAVLLREVLGPPVALRDEERADIL